MFSRSTPISLSGSPSLQPNNLSSLDELLCFVRFSDVILVEASGRSSKIPGPRSQIYQAFLTSVNGTKYVAVASNQGFQLWSTDGENMIYFFAISTILTAGEEEGHFMRGITQRDDYVAVGTSMGTVLLFGVAGHGNDTTMRQNIPTTNSPISALSSSSSQYLVCGADNGDLVCLDTSSAFSEAHKFPGTGTSITTLISFEDKAIAGFSSGHIRVYRLDVFELVIEITAHARCIMGLSLSPDKTSFASCGEDQCLNVWSIPDIGSPKSPNDIDLLFSEKIDNQLCTGLAYLPGNKVAVSSYDTDSAVVFARD